jgi:hypothetical protein
LQGYPVFQISTLLRTWRFAMGRGQEFQQFEIAAWTRGSLALVFASFSAKWENNSFAGG